MEILGREFDAILLLSFGGPEGQDDVIPFLENVTRGRGIPKERLEEVAHHYRAFGGVSPINAQCEELLAALKPALEAKGIDLPLYWGNRNWRPMLADTVQQMVDDGIKNAVTLVTSAFGSYSGCRQYREDLQAARLAVGEDVAPNFVKLRLFYNHPGFVEVMRDNVRQAMEQWPEDQRRSVRLIFTAHSIPTSMAYHTRYESQFHEASRLVADAFPGNAWELAYQSRSGPPSMPWLEPDICDRLEVLHEHGVNDAVIVPIGFVSDHMEVVYDLDTEAKELCEAKGIKMARASTVGTAPRFVDGLVDLIAERLANEKEPGSCDRDAMGCHGPSHDVCPKDCCLIGARPGGRPGGRPGAGRPETGRPGGQPNQSRPAAGRPSGSSNEPPAGKPPSNPAVGRPTAPRKPTAPGTEVL